MVVKILKYVGSGKPPFIPGVKIKHLGDGVFEFEGNVVLGKDWENVSPSVETEDKPKPKAKKKKDSKEEAE